MDPSSSLPSDPSLKYKALSQAGLSCPSITNSTPIQPGNIQSSSMEPYPGVPYTSHARDFEFRWLNTEMTMVDGTVYCEHLIPAKTVFGIPIVLIHGEFHTGSIWLKTADNRPGWANYFLSQGYSVYIIHIPPTRQSSGMLSQVENVIRPNIELIENEATSLANSATADWGTAKLHNQWPGTGRCGDLIFDQYIARLTPLCFEPPERQLLAQRAVASLIQMTGPAILIGEGTGANTAWLVADYKPEQVRAVLAIEPSGPPFCLPYEDDEDNKRRYTPFLRHVPGLRRYGLADIPMNFDPPTVINDIKDLEDPTWSPLNVSQVMRKDGPGSYYSQQADGIVGLHNGDSLQAREGQESIGDKPVRKLPCLQRMAHAVITTECSPHSLYDWATVKFLQETGTQVEHIELAKQGIHGNGPLCFLEKNSNQVAAVLHNWIQRNVAMVADSVLRVTSVQSLFTLSGIGQTGSAAGASGELGELAPPFNQMRVSANNHGQRSVELANVPAPVVLPPRGGSRGQQAVPTHPPRLAHQAGGYPVELRPSAPRVPSEPLAGPASGPRLDTRGPFAPTPPSPSASPSALAGHASGGQSNGPITRVARVAPAPPAAPVRRVPLLGPAPLAAPAVPAAPVLPVAPAPPAAPVSPAAPILPSAPAPPAASAPVPAPARASWPRQASARAAEQLSATYETYGVAPVAVPKRRRRRRQEREDGGDGEEEDDDSEEEYRPVRKRPTTTAGRLAARRPRRER